MDIQLNCELQRISGVKGLGVPRSSGLSRVCVFVRVCSGFMDVSKRCELVPTVVLFNLTHRDRKQKQLTPGRVIKTTKLFIFLSLNEK